MMVWIGDNLDFVGRHSITTHMAEDIVQSHADGNMTFKSQSLNLKMRHQENRRTRRIVKLKSRAAPLSDLHPKILLFMMKKF